MRAQRTREEMTRERRKKEKEGMLDVREGQRKAILRWKREREGGKMD